MNTENWKGEKSAFVGFLFYLFLSHFYTILMKPLKVLLLQVTPEIVKHCQVDDIRGSTRMN